MDKENVVCIHTVEYYSAFKKKILPFAKTQINREKLVLNEISQSQTKNYCMIALTQSI